MNVLVSQENLVWQSCPQATLRPLDQVCYAAFTLVRTSSFGVPYVMVYMSSMNIRAVRYCMDPEVVKTKLTVCHSFRRYCTNK